MKKHPIVEFVQVVSLLSIACISDSIVILAIVWLGSLFLVKSKKNTIIMTISVVIITMLVNALTNHRGETYLFYMNDNIVTLESIIYGSVLGFQLAILISLCMWVSQKMTSDKIIMVVSRFSSELGLLISMGIRSFERYRDKVSEIYNYQKAENSKEGLLYKILIGIRTISILITWALENGLETADSMKCRGYGSTRRTSYMPVSFSIRDLIELVLIIVVSVLIIVTNSHCMYSPWVEIDINWVQVVLISVLMVYEVVDYVSDRHRKTDYSE